jgi:hypothetical protein
VKRLNRFPVRPYYCRDDLKDNCNLWKQQVRNYYLENKGWFNNNNFYWFEEYYRKGFLQFENKVRQEVYRASQ